MNQLSVFVQELRRKSGVEWALTRLKDDFGVAEPLVMAAAWLGCRGVRPDAVLARKLDGVLSAHLACGHDAVEIGENCDPSLLHEFWQMIGTRTGAAGRETLAGWFLLVAPGSATCQEQSRWLETIRNACLEMGR